MCRESAPDITYTQPSECAESERTRHTGQGQNRKGATSVGRRENSHNLNEMQTFVKVLTLSDSSFCELNYLGAA